MIPTSDDVKTIKAALTAVDGVTIAQIRVTMHIQTTVPHFSAQHRIHIAEAKIIQAHPRLNFEFSTHVQVKS